MRKIVNKKFFLVVSMITLLSVNQYMKDDYDVQYEILSEDEDAFARYSNGLVYIGDKDYINSLKNVDENDVLVIDLRDSDNPDLQVVDSYRIKDKSDRREIVEILYAYEKMYPSSWDRTPDTMEFEWKIHNFSYKCNFKKNDTTDVDFDNNDGKFYESKIIRFVLKLK